MQIDKQQILQLLQDRGEQDKARQADEELPQEVDTDNEQHQSILDRLGLDPKELAKKFLGNKGIPGL